MGHLALRFGFPASRGHRFNLSGHRYKVGHAGVQTLRLLADIYHAYSPSVAGSWLFPMRGHVRQIEWYNATSVLSLVVERTEDPRLRVLAIWLRGRCRGTLGSSSLAKFRIDPHDQTRKEVARALQRMSAWGELRIMAASDPDPRIRRLAASKPPRPFPLRLSQCLRNVPRRDVTATKRGLFVAPHVDFRLGLPPGSRAVIRSTLERIRRIVAGYAR